MAGSNQTLGAIHRMAVQRGKTKMFLPSPTEPVHAVPTMSDTEKHCRWMRRKDIDAGPLKEALKGKQPFLLPFLHFCGLTIPKHSCCSACQGGLCCLHHEQQATKTSTSQGWQHLPPEELSMLKSIGNQGGAGWEHCSLKDTPENNIWGSEPLGFSSLPGQSLWSWETWSRAHRVCIPTNTLMDPQQPCAGRQERVQEAV